MNQGSDADNRILLPLVAIAAALGLWVAADSLREPVRELQQRLQTSALKPTRDVASSLEQAEAAARQARTQREAVELALQTAEPLELLQTRFLHDLRQRCAAAGVLGCVVKYSSDARTSAAASGAGNLADRSASEIDLNALGLTKVRAVISGSFQANELTDFISLLAREQGRAWRFVGLVVRTNNFELDLEQIVRSPTRYASASNGN